MIDAQLNIKAKSDKTEDDEEKILHLQLSSTEIREIIAEKFNIDYYDLNVLLNVVEKRQLIGIHGGIDERRQTTYNVTADIYCFREERAQKKLKQWKKAREIDKCAKCGAKMDKEAEE